MPEQHLFEYAVIRIVPKVEREEFINVGVILYCASQKFLKCLFQINESKIKAISDAVDLEDMKEYINSFEQICKGGPHGGPIGKLPLAERFRWLTATRSTVLQTSKVHPGLCDDAEEKLIKLFEKNVL